MKLAICIPLYGSIPANFFINFMNRIHELYTNGRNYEVRIHMKQGQPVDLVRNELVNMALQYNCDYIMFIDSDMILPPKAIDNLIDMNVDIASGLYFSKGKPFLPVARIYQDDKHFYLEDFEFDRILEVDGVGLGCCLIKSEIFKKIKYPWFKFNWSEWKGQIGQLAEDLYFFDEAKKLGYKVYLNTGITCNHFGTEVEPFHFMYFREQILIDKKEREELMDDLAEFEKIDRDSLLRIFLNYKNLIKEEIDKINFKDPKQVLDYYINNKYSIYDHFEWHLSNRRPFDKHIVETIKKLRPDKSTEILDYGCNGGQLAYMLAKEGYIVTVADYNKKALDFIKFRFEKHRLKVKIIKLPVPEIRNKYDIITCFDVLEHIPDEKFKEIIDLIKSLKKENALVFTTTSFGAQEFHPSHYDFTEEKAKLIKSLAE
jgi:2-polyprenyl-3-methyl-5-hydroxy-6-metoxy-1,4-benzoquinol methylase